MGSNTLTVWQAFRRTVLAIALSTTAIPADAQTTPGEPLATKMSLDNLAALPTMSTLRLSPKGDRMLATLGGGNDFLYAVIDLVKGGKPQVFATAQTYKDAGQRTLSSYRWFDDRYVLLTLTSRENVAGFRVDLQRLASFDTQTGKVQDLGWDNATADAADVLHLDPDNGRVLVARQANGDGNTERAFLYQVDWIDVASGKILQTVQRTNPIVNGWIADGDGIVRMGTSYDRDSGQARYLYRSGPKENFRTVQKTKDVDFTGTGIQPQIFLDEPDMAIVSSNHEGHDAIYKANLATMEITEKLFDVAGYDVGGAIPTEDEKNLAGYAYATDRVHYKWVDPKLVQVQQYFDEQFGESNWQIVSTNKGDTKFIIALARPSQLDTYYLYDLSSGSLKLVSYESIKLKDGMLNPVSMLNYKASDGLSMQAAVTMPRLRTGQKNLPVVVLTHGGPYGVRDYASYDQWAQSIAEQGYVVVQPNYRGSGGYGSEFLKAGRKDGFGTRMQDDLNDAVDTLAAQGTVDKLRACMMGWSYGGYASARAAQRDPDRWRCTIAGAGVYDLPKMRAYDEEYLGNFGANYLSKGAASLTDVSPARNAGGKWSPILIVHGVRDPRVPIEQARTLRDALKGAGKKEGVDYAYLEQPKNGHYGIYFTKEERLEWLGGATAWLARYNPAYTQDDADFAKKPPLDPAAKAMASKLAIQGL